MSNAKTKRGFNPWLIVLGALGCNSLLITLANVDGYFLQPIMDQFGWTRTEASLWMSIYNWVAAVIQFFVGKLFEKHDIRKIMAGIIVLFGVSYMWTSSFTHVWQWVIYGFIYGVCAGFFMYIPGALLITRWFKKRTGFAMSVPGIITGIIGIFFNPLVQSMIESMGWSSTRRVLGLVFMTICFLLTVLFVRGTPESVGEKPYGADEADEEISEGASADSSTRKGFTVSQAVKSPSLYLAIIYTFLVCVVACFIQQIMSYAGAFSVGAMAGAFALSIFSVLGMFRTPIIGWLMDKVGSMAGNLICCAVSTLGALLLMIGNGNSVPLLYVGVAMFSFMFSPLTQGTALLTRDVFGDKEYSTIYSFLTTSLLVSGGLAPLIYAQLYDRTQNYASYPVFVFIVALIVTIMTPVIYMLGKKSAKNMKIDM